MIFKVRKGFDNVEGITGGAELNTNEKYCSVRVWISHFRTCRE